MTTTICLTEYGFEALEISARVGILGDGYICLRYINGDQNGGGPRHMTCRQSKALRRALKRAERELEAS